MMNSKAVSAVFLAAIMVLSGCLGSEAVEEDPLPEPKDSIARVELLPPMSSTVGELVVVSGIYAVEGDGEPIFDFSVSHAGNKYTDTSTSADSGQISIVFIPDAPGMWEISSSVSFEGQSESFSDTVQFSVAAPDEGETILSLEGVIELAQEQALTITGIVIHSDITTCSVSDGVVTTTPDSDGSFSIQQGIVEESYDVTITAICGKWTESETSRLVRVILSGGDDMDGDGIPDDSDSCPDGYGEDEGWVPNEYTDYDSDGCHDFEEDRDDDNDMIPDVDDDCKSELGWVSSIEEDHDQDGCNDATEDSDDDNDGVLDNLDSCAVGETNWESKPYTDWDADGCQDFGEDLDDDNDMVLDTMDDCWRGQSNWISNSESDYDGDGCQDSTEDSDDDSDGVNDVNGTGVILDLCPRSPLNATDIDENGCDATERDTDGDGVMDADDQCEGTPAGIIVNEIGCADLDGDGVFSNADNCPDTESKWTPDANGCAVYQIPVAWKETGHGNGRMDTVAHFSLPTLDGTWSFRNEWNGEDVYLFLFKYTDSSGNGNSADWNKAPGSMLRQLPDNAHVFYGSFDNSYHNDVQNRKTAVEAALNANEEEKFAGRIHYIDMDMSNAQGGLGDLINNWGSLYYGIDRFQRAREVGSIYAWTSSTNDITHWAYETRMYNYEFPVEVREQDPNIHTVTIVDNVWHSGGWGGGYTSTYANVSMSLPNNISSYDTLEVFHEHNCEDRRNRYNKGDGSYGGCHEWDYLAYMKICDRDNSSKCGTEFMRWITTYGREGRWLTDITPYLFMLEEGDVRNFKYQGANKGDMTIKLLFSNWNVGERSMSGEQAFTGGQFRGEYNNESQYKRQHNFTAPQDYYKVKIVATITGHGFNQDSANCAEFCDHEHHYYLNGFHSYEWHPIVHDSQGCEKEVDDGVVANQFGSWPFGRAGWCAGQDVKQWTLDITDWVDNSTENNLRYKGLYQGQEYVPQNDQGGGREIRANIWLIWYQTA